MTRNIRAGDFVFRCDNDTEIARAKTFLTKEEGTIEWLKSNVKPGHVVYDVGANIGLYTVLAASLVGPHGLVYAFEPHVGNAHHLLRNVRANNFTDRVRIVTAALHSSEGFKPFNYVSKEPGSSGSQFDHVTTEDGKQFVPVGTELKYGTSIDTLLHDQVVRPASVVKIDVDGNERSILLGMSKFLRYTPVETIQVEVRPRDEEAILSFMIKCRYVRLMKHYTAKGKAALNKGTDPATLTYNAIFEPTPLPYADEVNET